MVIWLRKGDEELRKCIVVIAMDTYTTIAALNPNFKIPYQTHPVFAYPAIALWHTLALNRMAVLDDSMRATPGDQSSKFGAERASVGAPSDVCQSKNASLGLDPLVVLIAMVTSQCDEYEMRELCPISFRKYVRLCSGLCEWGTVEVLLFVWELCIRLSIVQAVHVRTPSGVDYVGVGRGHLPVRAIRYGSCGSKSAPKVLLRPLSEVDVTSEKLLEHFVQVFMRYFDAATTSWTRGAAATLCLGSDAIDTTSIVEWLHEMMQAIDDEYVETLLDVGVMDEYEAIGLVEMDEQAVELYSARGTTLFGAYQRIRNEVFSMAPIVASLRWREPPQSILLSDGRSIEIQRTEQHWGYEVDAPGGQVFLRYIQVLFLELQSIISKFRGVPRTAIRYPWIVPTPGHGFEELFLSNVWIPPLSARYRVRVFVREGLWLEERQHIERVFIPRQRREERLTAANRSGTRSCPPVVRVNTSGNDGVSFHMHTYL